MRAVCPIGSPWQWMLGGGAPPAPVPAEWLDQDVIAMAAANRRISRIPPEAAGSGFDHHSTTGAGDATPNTGRRGALSPDWRNNRLPHTDVVGVFTDGSGGRTG